MWRAFLALGTGFLFGVIGKVSDVIAISCSDFSISYTSQAAPCSGFQFDVTSSHKIKNNSGETVPSPVCIAVNEATTSNIDESSIDYYTPECDWGFGPGAESDVITLVADKEVKAYGASWDVWVVYGSPCSGSSVEVEFGSCQ